MQKPPEQTSPLPQVAVVAHGYSHAPLRHRPSAPHSVLNRQTGAAPVGLGWQTPETQQSTAEHSVLLVHEMTAAPPSPSVPFPLSPAAPLTPPAAGAPAAPPFPPLPPVPGLPPAPMMPP